MPLTGTAIPLDMWEYKTGKELRSTLEGYRAKSQNENGGMTCGKRQAIGEKQSQSGIMFKSFKSLRTYVKEIQHDVVGAGVQGEKQLEHERWRDTRKMTDD